MGLMGWALAGAVVAHGAQAHGIVDVLQQSQQARLEALAPAAAGERAARVQASFETLRRLLPAGLEVELRVVSGATLAETLHGRVVCANESLADLDEGYRLFVLAHELGHVVAGHWAQMRGAYERWIPGEVTPERTDPVAAPLGREASALSHRHEFEADAYGAMLLRRLGRPDSDALDAFRHLGMTQDTATHPATRKRLAMLRAVQAPSPEAAAPAAPAR